MDPSKLREYLTVLREMGVRTASLPMADGPFTVEFAHGAPPPVPLAPAGFVDKDGKAVDLDEGNPWRDDEPEGDPMLAANFPAKTDA